MNLRQQALENAKIAANNSEDSFKIGDRVACRGDYYGQIGTIVKEEKNFLGLRLLIIKLDDSCDDEYNPCLYPHELQRIPSTEI